MAFAMLSPDSQLENATEIWGNMLFWAFLMTTLVYVVVGVVCAVCLRVTKKGVSFIIPFLFLGCGELKVLCGDAVACAFVAGIYVTVGWSMSSLAAFGWGIGLSLTSLVLTTLISCVPMYPFL